MDPVSRSSAAPRPVKPPSVHILIQIPVKHLVVTQEVELVPVQLFSLLQSPLQLRVRTGGLHVNVLQIYQIQLDQSCSDPHGFIRSGSVGGSWWIQLDPSRPIVDGRVFQVEYAMKAVENSSTAIAIRCKDGVVFGVEKLVLSKLYEEGSNKRIFNIDRHVGMAVAGLLADARSLADVAREEASGFRSNYGHDIPLKHLADRVAMYVHAYTLYSAVRPFGCSFILGSYDKDDGPQLYMVDPSGISHGYWGCAIGKAKQAAKTEIEKLQMKDMTCRELVKEVAKIIYIVHDEVKDKAFELELSWVGEVTNGRHELVPKDVREEAEKYAKDSLEEEDDSDEDNM
ncbi:uncharacterized protein V6R79_004615 [Siganus canaliculatus]